MLDGIILCISVLYPSGVDNGRRNRNSTNSNGKMIVLDLGWGVTEDNEERWTVLNV